MSKVRVTFPGIRETYHVSAATVTTGWIAGQLMKINSSNTVELGGADSAVIVAIDPSTDLAAPPTSSLVTGMHGAATLFIDHAAEIAAEVATRCYESDVESADLTAGPPLLYASENGKWTTSATGSAKGSLIQIPTAANSRQIGIMLRM